MSVGVTALLIATGAVGAALVLDRPVAPGGRLEPRPVEIDDGPSAVPSTTRTATQLPSSALPQEVLSPGDVALLPEARYDAVVAGLMDATEPGMSAAPAVTYSVLADAPLYGADRVAPVARLAAVNFLGEPTVIVPVRSDGEWALVLTPARRSLPSTAGGVAAAQTAGWIRTDALVDPRAVTHRIVVSVSAQRLDIVSNEHVVSVFDVGVGSPGTPTPHGVTGYLQARYLDPAQGQTEHRVQLTSLHSTSADEPYGGTDGGLIGIHYSEDAGGAVSHGCIRVSGDAIRAVDALPLGTPISVIE